MTAMEALAQPVRHYRRLRDYLAFPPAPQIVRRWLIVLVAVDLALVLFHLAWRGLQVADLLGPIPPQLSTFGDIGLAERFNHGKWLVLVTLLLLTWRQTRVAGFLALAGVFGLVLIDDALQVHEQGSVWLQQNWAGMPRFGISAGEAGELMIWSGLGLAVLGLMVWGIPATPRAWWPVLGYIGVAFAGLVFFAVVWDVMQEPLHHIAHPSLRYWSLFLAAIVEVTGEAVFASLALAYGAGIYGRSGRARLSRPAAPPGR